MNKTIFLIAFSILISGYIAGCDRRADGSLKVPLVYRVDVQQGNVIEQSMVNKLEPGMTKAKVKFIMGTPLLVDSFHSNRWDYIYSNEPGDGERAQRHIALFFKNDKLTHIEGDITTGYRHAEEDVIESSNVVVTGERKKKGFFSGVFSSDKKKKNDEGFFDRWFGSDEELKKADETRDKETQEELEAIAEEVNERADDSYVPLPEWDADKVRRDFEVLEQMEEEF